MFSRPRRRSVGCRESRARALSPRESARGAARLPRRAHDGCARPCARGRVRVPARRLPGRAGARGRPPASRQLVLVKALYIYPVKGCRAVARDDAALDALGLAGDRRFVFLGAEGRAVTQRDQPLLATVQPTVGEDAVSLDLGGLVGLTVEFESFQRAAFVDVW